MGQYWKAVNLDKKQYLDPWDLDTGAKLYEQLANPATGRALVFLLSPLPMRRGGGDIDPHPLLGSWAGDRIVMVGDYSENSDCKSVKSFSKLYGRLDSYENVSPQVKQAVHEALVR